MKIIEVKLTNKKYEIYIEKNSLNSIGQFLKANYENKKIAIVTDDNLKNLYGKMLSHVIGQEGFSTKLISVQPGEKSKSIEILQKVYQEFSDFKLTRGDLIITLGGGVIGDLGGFAASTYLRGIPYIQIPTSLLAQVDSSIGGKVAVDLPWGKNLVGSFYHPEAVFIDSELLKTLEKRFLYDGLSEVIKYGLIRDKAIVLELMKFQDEEKLLENIDSIIYRCCSIKKDVVEADEKDFGERMLLNFGHTLGHAIEKYFEYNKFTHGEAVAMGMAEITKNSEKLNITERGTSEFIEKILRKYKLPFKSPTMNEKEILNSIALDKKNNGDVINLILLKRIGEGFIKKVPLEDIEKFFKSECI